MIYRGLTMLIVITVIVGAVLLSQQHFTARETTAVQRQNEEPGYAARDAELTETGDDGRALYRLNATVIRERPKDGTVELDEVQINYRAENSTQWALTAEHGSVRERDEHIELMGNVRAIGVVPGLAGLAQILTDRLRFDTHTEVVSTPDPVKVLWAGGELNGTGLNASLKDRRFRLESAVHGRFTP